MQNGWALQTGTSHFLGQNFAKAFNVYYQTEQNSRDLVWATSWGVSTRLIGALLMTHSDDKGVVLPPKVAPTQIVVVPIYGSEEDANITLQCRMICNWLNSKGYRVYIDDRKSIRPGAKFYEWERKGVPLRIDLGKRDLGSGQVTITARNGLKKVVGLSENDLVSEVSIILNSFHEQLLKDAFRRLENSLHRVQSYLEMKNLLQKSEAGLFLVPWKDDAGNEELIKNECKATIRCFPFEYNREPLASNVRCFFSGEPATHMALFARAF